MSIDLTRRELFKAVGAGVAIAGLVPSSVVRADDGAVDEAGALKLWYRRPATRWVEALPLGNGRLGAMVWGGIEHERLQLNEDTLYAGGPYDANNPEALAALPEVRRLIFAGRYAEAEALANAKLMSRPLKQMPYQPLADLVLDFRDIPDSSEYRRELDLDTAISRTQFRTWKTLHTREAFVSPVDQCIAVRLATDRPGAIDLRISLDSDQQHEVLAEDGSLLLRGRNGSKHGHRRQTEVRAACARAAPRRHAEGRATAASRSKARTRCCCWPPLRRATVATTTSAAIPKRSRASSWRPCSSAASMRCAMRMSPSTGACSGASPSTSAAARPKSCRPTSASSASPTATTPRSPRSTTSTAATC